ncbi:helix-hairpin-helix domain-containing protein [Streptomyces sp. CAU 1734]|uniref:helix-hairpin-helix domain-containing protein n=1 Tax=Streptomyces sp. CAU 1734 TaxID=3140360 RepID=UPI00326115F6
MSGDTAPPAGASGGPGAGSGGGGDRESAAGGTEAPETGAGPEKDGAEADGTDEPGADPDGTDQDGADQDAKEADGAGGGGSETAEPGAAAAAADAAEVSEAAAELAAQRELRARIEQRKAERDGPVESGTKLSGKAADLLAAVRAVESGGASGSAFFASPEPAPAAAPGGPASASAGPAAGRAPVPRAAGGAAPGPVPRAATAATAPGTAARAVAPGAVAAVAAVLTEGGMTGTPAARVTDALGERAAELLRADPWQLLSVPGIRPEQADGFARSLLGGACGPGDERRTAALVVWRLERAALRGHTALESSAVREALVRWSVPDPDAVLEQAVADSVVLAFQDGPEEDTDTGAEAEAEADTAGEGSGGEPAAPGPVLLGLDRYALAEESLADGLARLARSGADARWEAAAEHAPAALARAAAESGLVAHTGGEAARAEPIALARAAAGIGLRAVVAVHSAPQWQEPAPDVVTLTGLLSGAEGPGRDTDGALALDLLVVLDAPQLDVETAAVVVESLPDGGRLVLSGDPALLGSAGPGRVFADLLAAGVCPRIASRVPDPGPLGELVSGIGAGELNQVAAPDKEIVIVPVRDAGEAVHRTVQLVADSVPRAIGVRPDRTQVITVGHGGSAGTRALNTALKARLNPGPGRFGGFDPGDRVAYAPALGRTVPGTVVSADAEGLLLECGETRVTVPRERVESAVRHGWAMTAHQAAGLRWPAVVVVLPGDAADALSRPWVYTAFSRGERHLSVVHGVEGALARSVAGIPSEERTTRLRTLLEELPAPAAH